MKETLKFPALAIGPATGKLAHPGREQFQMFYTEGQFLQVEAPQLRRGDRNDMLLIDGDLRCWKVDGVIDLGVIDEGLLAKVLGTISRTHTHRLDYELTALDTMTLQQVRDRVEAAIRTIPWEWERDENDIIGRLIARIHAAPTLLQIIEALEVGPDDEGTAGND